MHIVYATTSFIDNLGPTTGLPKYLLRVSMALIELGHEVTIVTCSNRSVVYDFMGIHIRRVRRPNIVTYGNQEKDTEAFFMRDASIVHEELLYMSKYEKIDIIQYTSLSAIAYFHDFDIPTVLRLSSYSCMVPIRGKELQQNTKAKLERESAKRCNAVFAPSEVVAKKFGNDTGIDVKVIETPFLLERNIEDSRVYDLLFNNKKYILFYGTLIEYKGLGVIADAIYDILKSDSNLYIGIIGSGDGKLVGEIKENAKEYEKRVIYHDALGFSQLLPIIKNAQAIMLPSLTENFSNACVESMALEKIVIGTRGASFDQLIEDGVNGFLCDIGDADSLVNAVMRLLSLTGDEKNSMQKLAKKRTDLLAPEIVVRQLLDFYGEVIENFGKC